MVPDLSHYHHPVGHVFQADSNSERCRLSPSQISAYQEHGYVAGIRLLSDEQVAVLRSELEQLTNPTHPGRPLFYEYHSNESSDPRRMLFHALGAWRVVPGFHDLLWNPSFTVPAAQLLGGPVRFWHDQIFYKPARHGGVVAWHQDYSYWTRTTPMAHLSCWIGLDDATSDNGCLQYVPGSHRWDLLPVTGLVDNMDAIQSVLTAEQRAKFRPVAIELKKGEAAFHHPLMVHGSFANNTDRSRRATVINVLRDGVRSASNEPLLEGVPPITRGSKIDGQFFPLLFNPGSVQQFSGPSGIHQEPDHLSGV